MAARKAPQTPSDDPASLAALVERVAQRLPFRALCLEQAIALRRMLLRRGWRPVIHLGVGRTPEARKTAADPAHAWLSLDGVVLLGHREMTQFREVARFVSDAPGRKT